MNLTEWKNHNLVILLFTAIVGWVLTIVFAVLFGVNRGRVIENDRSFKDELLPTPVVLKVGMKNYKEDSNFKRMIISGFNTSGDADDNKKFTNEESPGILRWKRQHETNFWYLEVTPLRSSNRDCPVKRNGIFGRYEPGAVVNPVSRKTSVCNLYDFRLVIYNDLDQGATVHFHGLTPPSNQDGVPFVSNANIHPKNLQSYRFNQFTYPGLHWMHSHTGFQQAFGVAAPIVLHHSDPYYENNVFNKEDDYVVMLEEGFIYPLCAYSGRWWYANECSFTNQTNFAKLALLINRQEEPLDYTPQSKAKFIRVRFLNGGSEAPWNITSNASMEILATDGQDVERGVKRETFVLGLANRMDVLLEVESKKDILITCKQMKHSGDVTDPALRYLIIRGQETNQNDKIRSDQLPKFLKNGTSPILKNFNLLQNLSAAHPLIDRYPTRNYTVWNYGGDQFGGFPLTIFEGLIQRLTFRDATPLHGKIQNYTALNQLKFQLPPYKVYRNNVTNEIISTRRNCTNCNETKSGIKPRPPTYGGIYNISLLGDNNDNTGGCCWEWCDVPDDECENFHLEDVTTYKENENYIPVCYGDRVRIMFINTGSFEKKEGHPMHLHGHDFVLRELYNASSTEDQKLVLLDDGFPISGPKLDSIWVPYNQAVVFDFDAYNPGEHLFHCHNDFHLENGMMTTIRYMHDDYCNDLPEFLGGESSYPNQTCSMDGCSPPKHTNEEL